MKTCRSCGETKPLTEFHRHSKGRVRPDCRECRRPGKRAYYLANREAILAKQKAARDADPETFYRRRRERRDPERKRAYEREYRKSHREQRDAPVRAWVKAHPDRVRQYRRKSENKRRARKKALPYEDVDPQLVFERDGGICGICGGSVDPSAWHLDHVIPLAQGGPHTYANVQTTHPFCNLSKGGRGHERQGESISRSKS